MFSRYFTEGKLLLRNKIVDYPNEKFQVTQDITFKVMRDGWEENSET